MPEEYNRAILKMVIAQICQMIGWHSINSTPLEFLVDLMQEYLLRISKLTKQYAEVLGRTEGNLDDLGLAFQHMHVLIPELSEYVRNVDSLPCIVSVPKFPVHRENHLNFLKPGSQEVVTRSVHVHEHLPAMYPDTEEPAPVEQIEAPRPCQADFSPTSSQQPMDGVIETPLNQSNQPVFKRPGGLLPSEHNSLAKRPKMLEEGRPLREIHSVIMTTSGFLSPAREGKLPEPRTPHPARAESPPPVSSYPMVPPELKPEKKPKKAIKKGPEHRNKLDKENKKKIRVKELFKPDNISDIKTKKLANAKEHAKLQSSKPSGSKGHASSPRNSNRPSSPQLNAHKENSPKVPKAPQTKIKTERVPETTSVSLPLEEKEDVVYKLPSEPDKQKLNIFKKISKPREEKSSDGPEPSNKYKDLDSRESSPGLIIDEISDKGVQSIDIDSKRDEKKIPKTPDVHIDEGAETNDPQSPPSDVYIFGDMSPPGTPSTPKTPELEVPVMVDIKKKKKERNVRKKEPRSKSPKRSISPKKAKTAVDIQESLLCDRPKTPQAVEAEAHRELNNPPTLPFPFFPPFPSAPGLIPHPMAHSIFPRYPLPLGRNVPGIHPSMPNLPIAPRFLTTNILPDEFLPPKTKGSEREKKPVTLPPEVISTPIESTKNMKSVTEKIPKSNKIDKEMSLQATATSNIMHNDVISPTMPVTTIAPVPTLPRLMTKPEKPDKSVKTIKKTKDHKKERKDKLKKKKEKKEKHKIKDKSKGKKGKLTKLKDKKDKKDKRKDKEKDNKTTEAVPKITLKLGPASPRPPTPDNTTMKKITIKPLIKKPVEEKKREPSPELAKISALVTRPPKQKLMKFKTDVYATKDDIIPIMGNHDAVQPITVDPNRQVWICPACGNQDDGSPMIGCDDCDAWYHWVCVGVQVPPADHEDWYCRNCIAKKEELHHDKKKKKRKRKIKATA
ncbi:transcription initiation factor TFIID subunit 3 isoform X2 [Venturia canescens]|uniref:transcription initiation factor TFIID subunit 3 isoform X2 n=1 Tax=Venturia canescens TaxID=32260 RepID=UPI001C9C2EA4|nr:transcription initiation factor TFIID subunit 3 isoform X2 [Venturia canescens]